MEGKAFEWVCCALSNATIFYGRDYDNANEPLTKYFDKISTAAAVANRMVKWDNLPCSSSKTSDVWPRQRRLNGCVMLWAMEFLLIGASMMMQTSYSQNTLQKLALQRPWKIVWSNETISPVLPLKPQMCGWGKGVQMDVLCFEKYNSFWWACQWWCE